METTINRNKYKGNAGHVRKAEREHASACRRLERNGRGERRVAREDRKGTAGRKERTETKWHVEMANVYYTGALRIMLIPHRGLRGGDQEIHALVLAQHVVPFYSRALLKTKNVN